MPIYEFRCQDCHRKSSVFVRSMTTITSSACERCGSPNLVRVMSSFSVVRGTASVDDTNDDLSAGMGDVDEDDPRSVGRWMRRMKDEMGEDAGPEFDEMVDKLEAGEMPEELAQEDVDGDDAQDDTGGEE